MVTLLDNVIVGLVVALVTMLLSEALFGSLFRVLCLFVNYSNLLNLIELHLLKVTAMLRFSYTRAVIRNLQNSSSDVL